MLPAPLDTRPCASCPQTPCCFRFRVVVSPADVHRLARETGRSPLEAFVLHPDPTGDVALDAGPTRYLLCLPKQASFACIFLEGGRCTVHAARPMVCRSFPLTPTADGFGTTDFVCPPVWRPDHIRQDEARRLHALWRIERALGSAFVERWNRIAACAPAGRARSPRMFYWWMLEIFDALQATLAVHTRDVAATDALLSAWDAGPGPWTPAIDDALARLDVALRTVRERDATLPSR
jgi:Fe-S-cluster containining protein